MYNVKIHNTREIKGSTKKKLYLEVFASIFFDSNPIEEFFFLDEVRCETEWYQHDKKDLLVQSKTFKSWRFF